MGEPGSPARDCAERARKESRTVSTNPKRRAPPAQQDLRFPSTWGGKRPGAGRPRSRLGPRMVPHRARPLHKRAHPVHVTLRLQPDLGASIRHDRFRALRRLFTAATKQTFQVVHFSAQSNHFHLIVEADDSNRLARGMQGLAVRIARTINRVLGRRGRVLRERYHARALTSPRSVRNALVYVLQNFKKHRHHVRPPDPCSSGPWFNGWRDVIAPPRTPPPVAPARTWLA